MKRRLLTWGVVLGLAVAAVGCGSSSSKGGGGSGGSLDHPAKLVFLWEIKGESPDAIDDFQNGASMAVKEINAAGGIDGQKVQSARVSSSATDPQKAISAFLQAVDENPTVMIGYPSGLVEAVVPSIERAGIPTIAATEDDGIRFGAPSGSQWLFDAKPLPTQLGTFGIRYLTENLHAKKVALLSTNDRAGVVGSDTGRKALKAAGLRPFVSRQFPTTTTDLTAQVVATRGADGVAAWEFPNTLAATLRQLAQNGIRVPVMASSSGALVVNYGLAKGDAIKNLHVVSGCNPTDPNIPRVNKFATEYQRRYHAVASTEAAVSYDAVHVAVAAIQKAHSTDPAKVRDALRTVRYTGGVCAPVYHSDGSQILHHQAVIMDFPGGKARTLKTYNVPDEPKAK